MPLSDLRETGANALIPRVAGGRRASETTQCACHHSAARRSISDRQSARSALATQRPAAPITRRWYWREILPGGGPVLRVTR